MDDLSHVLILLIAEKLRSHVDKLIGKVSATCISLDMLGYIFLESTEVKAFKLILLLLFDKCK
jgi:hypothetical protein